jgi:hypothetical protein
MDRQQQRDGSEKQDGSLRKLGRNPRRKPKKRSEYKRELQTTLKNISPDFVRYMGEL